MFTNVFVALLAIASTALSFPVEHNNYSPTTRTIFQLDQEYTWFENLAVRPSGQLLVTRTDVPEIWLIDPFTKCGSRIVTVPGVEALLGIAEMAPDVYVFAAANFTFQTGFAQGSAQVWELTFSGPSSKPNIRLINSMPDAGLPNGVLRWDAESVLIADSTVGQVIKFNTKTGVATSVIQDATMLPIPNITLQFGINGIDSVVLGRQTYLYYTNTELGLFCRVPVDSKTAMATGPIETILENLPGDDLVVLSDGTALIAANAENIIVKVTVDGKNSTVAGGETSLVLESDTSFKFGRTARDSNTLYVATAGGYVAPINGTVRRPASIVAVDFHSRLF